MNPLLKCVALSPAGPVQFRLHFFLVRNLYIKVTAVQRSLTRKKLEKNLTNKGKIVEKLLQNRLHRQHPEGK